MIRHLLLALVIVIVGALALPPLWYAVLPNPVPELPPPGRRVELSRGVGVNVIEEGEGPPVVLVHGHPGSAYDWRHLMPRLAGRGLRALAYDRVGWGHSDWRAKGSFTVDANAKELLALLETRSAYTDGFVEGVYLRIDDAAHCVAHALAARDAVGGLVKNAVALGGADEEV